jgi:hypothetical protein
MGRRFFRWFVRKSDNQAWGGTAKQAWGGTANQAWGGTAKQAWGGTAKQAWGGTAKQAWGGTAKQAWGGRPFGTANDYPGPLGVEKRVARPSKPLNACKLRLGRGRRGAPQSSKHGQAIPSRRLHSCLAVPPEVALGGPAISVAVPNSAGPSASAGAVAPTLPLVATLVPDTPKPNRVGCAARFLCRSAKDFVRKGLRRRRAA